MEFIQQNWMALAAIAALVIVPRLGKLPIGDWLAKLKGGASDLLDVESAPDIVALQAKHRDLTAALHDAGKTTAVEAMTGPVAAALGEMAFSLDLD